jgi:hypothetical protein
MPIFLIALFGVILAFRTGIVSEQVQQSVRYGGLVTGLANPYEAYSLYTVYATIDGQTPPHIHDCVGGTTSVIAQGHPGFWLPSTGMPATSSATCNLGIVTTAQGVSSPVMLFADYAGAQAQPQAQGMLAGKVFGGNNISATQNFFRSPDLGTILNCTNLGAAVKNSLEGENDTSPLTVPTPFPTTVTATATDVVPSGQSAGCYATNTFTAPSAPY